uniref:Uncharacterized protein n=1 Tax=Anopheles melas TaxID=34690 RepID=A0A182TTH1_9DIPT
MYTFTIPVKFLREVTPYFRKASIISEVGWELQRAFLCPLGPNASSPPGVAPRSPPRADTRYIPLQLTHLARNLKYHDPAFGVASFLPSFLLETMAIFAMTTITSFFRSSNSLALKNEALVQLYLTSE